MSVIEQSEYLAPDGRIWNVEIHQDIDGESPRDWDNATVLITCERHYTSPDTDTLGEHGLPEEYANPSNGIDMRRMSRYLNLFRPDIARIGWAGLHRGGDGDLFVDWRQDTGDANGIAFLPWKNIEKIGDVEDVRSIIVGEVDTYNQWATGDIYMAISHDPEGNTDACGGLYGLEYAREFLENDFLPDMLVRVAVLP